MVCITLFPTPGPSYLLHENSSVVKKYKSLKSNSLGFYCQETIHYSFVVSYITKYDENREKWLCRDQPSLDASI